MGVLFHFFEVFFNIIQLLFERGRSLLEGLALILGLGGLASSRTKARASISSKSKPSKKSLGGTLAFFI